MFFSVSVCTVCFGVFMTVCEYFDAFLSVAECCFVLRSVAVCFGVFLSVSECL